MRIVHLSTDDALAGAGRAAARLHEGLRRLGHDSKMLVASRRGTDPATIAFKPPRDLRSKVRRKLRRRRIERDFARYAATRGAGHEPFTDDRTPDGGNLVGQLPMCDVLNLHHIRGLLDHSEFFSRVPRDLPMVWRLADMGPLTGGCHYDENCGRFEQTCGACPQLGSSDENDLSRRAWLRKSGALDALHPERLHLVATSRWIEEQARRSSLLKRFPITVIPNGLDLEEFAPRDQAHSRELLGVPAAARVVLFVGAMHNPRKGFTHLLDALERISDRFPGLMLLTLGSGKPPARVPVPHVRFAYSDHDRFISTVYSAADVFAMTSLQESFGQTVTESMACGTPVVGFATGGMLDTVRPGQTGAIAPVGDAAGLAAALADVLTITGEPASRDRLSRECRRVAAADYSLDLQAKRFAALYEKLVPMERVHGS